MLIAPLAILMAQPEPTVLLDQSFTLHESSDKAAESQGLYAMHAEEDEGQITITESVQLETKIGTVDLTSIVVYKQGDDKEWTFQAAAATTGIDGNIVMKVNVQPNDNAWKVETIYLRDPRGEALDEPKTSKRTIEVAKGPVLFSSARAVMGPRLQPKPGKLLIVWVEFPDDIDEDITIKEGFSLVREQPDDEESYTLWIASENQTIGPLPLTAQEKILPHKLWDKMLMREEVEE